MEACILNTNNVLIVLSKLKDESSIKDFCGLVIRVNDISSAVPLLSQKNVYLCGDISKARGLDLKTAERIFVIKELSHDYNDDVNKTWPFVDL